MELMRRHLLRGTELQLYPKPLCNVMQPLQLIRIHHMSR